MSGDILGAAARPGPAAARPGRGFGGRMPPKVQGSLGRGTAPLGDITIILSTEGVVYVPDDMRNRLHSQLKRTRGSDKHDPSRGNELIAITMTSCSASWGQKSNNPSCNRMYTALFEGKYTSLFKGSAQRSY